MRHYYFFCMGLICIAFDSFAQSFPNSSGNARIRDLRAIERLLDNLVTQPKHAHLLYEAENLSQAILLKNPECQIQLGDVWLGFLKTYYPGSVEPSQLDEQLLVAQNFVPKIRMKELDESLFEMSLALEKAGHIQQAIVCAERAARSECSDPVTHQKNLNQLGYLCYQSGQYFKAAKTFREEIDWCKKHQLELQQACALNNLGSIYVHFQAPEKALTCFEKSLEIRERRNDLVGLINLSINIGSMYVQLHQLAPAKKRLYAALVQATAEKDQLNLGIIHCNLAEIAIQEMQLERAQAELRKAIDLLKPLNSNLWLGHACEKMGRISLLNQQTKVATRWIQKSLHHSKKGQNIELLMRVHETAYKIYIENNEAEKALDQLTHFVEIRDSLDSAKSLSDFLMAENQSELNEANEQLSTIYQTKLENNQSKTSNLKVLTYSITGGLILALLLGYYLYTLSTEFKLQRNQLQAQGVRLTNQHVLLTNSHKEIKDSIVYAQRIQNAILPYVEDVREVFPKSFMIYQPKDVVAGDFYWIQAIDDSILFAVADCTGHGVPGAMVSVICINALNRCVREHRLSDPAAILNKTRTIVIDEFEQAREEIKDGMDIALCKIQGNQLTFAGANNPVWILRHRDWTIGKPARQPIGKYLFSKPFKNWTYDLQTGDKIYLFSDGFPDQFGGQKGKKLKKAKLKEWLTESAVLSMDDQGEILQRQFLNWKGKHEQVDDVCLFGLEI